MKMYEVRYKFTGYHDKDKVYEEVAQMAESRLNEIRDGVAKQDFYIEVEVLKDLGEKDETWLDTWLKIGKKNWWICEADDPPFTKAMFSECKTIEYLIDRMKHGNWCLGQAFYYKDLCFINQIDGGDEWLTIRRGLSFESASCKSMIEGKRGEQYFRAWVEDCLNATDEQLRKLEYTNTCKRFDN